MARDLDPATLDAITGAVAAAVAARMSPASAASAQPLALRELQQLPPGFLPSMNPEDPRLGLQIGAHVAIDSVEYTQSTQYNGSASPGYGTNNAVPLVAWKAMFARAFPSVRVGVFGGDDLTGRAATGELVLSVGDKVLFRTGPTRAAGARIGPVARIDRNAWDREQTISGGGGARTDYRLIFINCPLNFSIPAYYCRPGRLFVSVKLWPTDEGPTSSRATEHHEYLWFNDVQAPRVCLVRVNWTDSNGNVTRPSDASMLGTLSVAERMLPFPYFDTTILGTEVTSSAAFATAATNGGCNPAWGSLLTDLNVTRIFTALFQLGDIVYGMVPSAAIPAGPGSINSGCGRGAGGGFVGYATTFAHELGHLYGRSHVAVSGDPSNDTAYPNYGGSSTSIGETGIDTGTSPPSLFDPASSADLMSYGSNQWISPYTYQKIFDARSAHQSSPVDPRRVRSLLVVDFRYYREVAGIAQVKFKTVAHVRAAGAPPTRPAGAPSPVSIDLRDANQQVLATHHCVYVAAHGGGRCSCCSGDAIPLEREPWLDMTEVIEWPGDAVASLAFHRGGQPVHVVDVGEAPSVTIEGPLMRDGQLTVRVCANHPREHVSVLVLFSADDGQVWQLVTMNPERIEVTFNTANLPGGERCRVRAIGTAEFRSSQADTEAFTLARNPRQLLLDLPDDQCQVPAGAVALAVRVDNRGYGALAPQEISWSSSLDGHLGFGYGLVAQLSEGRHELTVSAASGIGDNLSERGIIIVGGRHR